MQPTILITGITFMTSGRIMCNHPSFQPLFVFQLLFVVLFLFLATVNVFAKDADIKNDRELQQLLAPFAVTPYIKLAYLEKRFSLFLKQPQEFRGSIEYTRPDQLIKQVLSPTKKRFVIQHNQLTIYTYESKNGNDNKTESKQTVSLDDYPQFKQYRAIFTGLLEGNAAQITQHYRYEIYSMPDDQTGLMLKPQIADPFTQEQQNINKHIEIIFHHQLIKKITMTGFGGERSELYIERLNTKKQISENRSSENHSSENHSNKNKADTQ